MRHENGNAACLYRCDGRGDVSHPDAAPDSVSKKIKNRFIRSFLYYIPYAVLGAMTFPAILYSTGSVYSALAGLAVAMILAFLEKSLLTVALCSCAAVFLAELLV